MSPQELAALAKRVATELGFDACGVTDASAVPHADALTWWLGSGYHGEMRYMASQAETRRQPKNVWPRARSIVVVLDNYYIETDSTPAGYRVARYAQGKDYHAVIRGKLDQLGLVIAQAAGQGAWRSYVDAGPMPERELAQRAGLGWIAKNTMLIRPDLGSYTFIGCVLTDLELERDAPFEADRCGSCTRCLEACPTGAFPEPRVLDATRCISYLTIEARSDVPEALRPLIGDHLFGCDVCQEVCPWNVKFAAETLEPHYRPQGPWPSLGEILALDDHAFDRRFGDTALERARRTGLRRNALVVLENAGR